MIPGQTEPAATAIERPHVQWEGQTGDALARRLSVPHVAVYEDIESTMDVAHGLAAAGAAAGTLVLADRQTAGRGRGGHSWASGAGRGIWMTLVERPRNAAGIEPLSVRCGLRLARALDPYVGDIVGIKWPNDLYVGSGKVGGILIEARWQDQHLLWVAIGVGINVLAPIGVDAAAGLHSGTSRLDVLGAVVSAVLGVASLGATLTAEEQHECARRDIARGRACREPAVGRVVGVGSRGELLVETTRGVQAFLSGSLTFDSGGEAA
jgi:BirA family transcriptional regulator, biotin operon repressor / biotin---[acetyl-CoA-carboxylase] ligase